MPGEADRIEAFRRGLPRPERSVRTWPWLARIAVNPAAGKQRVRVLDEPLTEYQRYQLGGYVESQAVGDEIRVARRGAAPHLAAALATDFWLFDGTTAVILAYDGEGAFTSAQARPRRRRAHAMPGGTGHSPAPLGAAERVPGGAQAGTKGVTVR